MSLSRTHKMGAITSKTTTISVDDTEIRTVKYDVRLENIKYVFGMLVGCGIIIPIHGSITKYIPPWMHCNCRRRKRQYDWLLQES